MRWFFGFQEKKPLSFSCAKYLCYGLEGWDYSLSIVHHGKISFSIHIKKDIVQPRSISFIEIYPAARNFYPLPPVFNGGSFTGVCTRLYCTFTVWHGHMAMLYIYSSYTLTLEFFFLAGWRKSVVMYRSTERIRNVLCIFKPTGLI